MIRSVNRPGQPVPTALIDEAECIGCTLCIQACPFDAIVGAARRMHTVVEPLCVGCGLCLPPCPVDCISIVAATPERLWTTGEAAAAGARVKARKRRLEREQLQQHARLAARAQDDQDAHIEVANAPARSRIDRIAAIVARAVERARRRRSDLAR